MISEYRDDAIGISMMFVCFLPGSDKYKTSGFIYLFCMPGVYRSTSTWGVMVNIWLIIL